MAAFVYAESARCPQGHPLLLSLDQEATLLVDDEVCRWCKVVEDVREAKERGLPDKATRGTIWSIRAKNEGRPSRGNQ